MVYQKRRVKERKREKDEIETGEWYRVNFKSCSGSLKRKRLDRFLVSSSFYWAITAMRRGGSRIVRMYELYILHVYLCGAAHYGESRSSVEAEMGHRLGQPYRFVDRHIAAGCALVSFLVRAYFLSCDTRREREREKEKERKNCRVWVIIASPR